MKPCGEWPIGVCSWSLRQDIGEVAATLKELGLDHVHMALGLALDDPAGPYLAAVKAQAWTITGTMVGFPQEDYSSLDSIRRTGGIVPDDVWPANRRRCLAAIKLTAELKVPYLSGHLGFLDHADAAAARTFQDRVRELADAAAAAGITLLMETGQETAADLRRLLEALQHPALGVNFDPANMILYDKGAPAEAVRELGPWIRHVHAKDAQRTRTPGEWGVEVPWGDGEVGGRSFLDALRAAGFRGALAIEREAGTQRRADIGLAAARLSLYRAPAARRHPAGARPGRSSGRVLLRDDFAKLPLGLLPQDNTAIGEYHFQPSLGDTTRWYPATNRVAWTVLPKPDGGRRLTGRRLMPHNETATAPTLVAGEALWSDYEARVRVQPLLTEGAAGLACRYESSRTHYRLVLADGRELRLLYVSHRDVEVLAAAPFAYNTDTVYELALRLSGERLCGSVAGGPTLEATDRRLDAGRVALVAEAPAAFESIEVTGEARARAAFVQRLEQATHDLEGERAKYPQPALWKQIAIRGFGAGRQIRWGDLDGDGRLEFVLGQGVQPGWDVNVISCLTAVNLDGRVLWQFGEPRLKPGILTADLPFQIYDLDGDGHAEVLCAAGAELVVLDGRTGAVKNCMRLPLQVRDPEAGRRSERYFDRLACDSIMVANFRGGPHPADLVVKDRYHRVWALDSQGRELWTAPCRTGHFPQPYDFDGDGRDELFAGYTMLGPDGAVRWSKDWGDHTDEIVIGAFDPDRPGVQLGLVCGDEGFNLLAPDGTVLHRDPLGHAQRVSAAKFRADLPGLQFYVVTYWNNPGIISLHDCRGRRLFSFEPTATGSILNPVNWTGDGTELALLSGSVRHGGMIDGYGRRVVLFPDDGHPELAAESINLTGDARDEIVLWDRDRLWIYTQDRAFGGARIHTPRRFPHHNASNYRGETSLPGIEGAAAVSGDQA